MHFQNTFMRNPWGPSCADLPEMIRVLCLPDPSAIPADELEDARWHISACRGCYRAVYRDDPPFCEKLRLLPRALYRTGLVAVPNDPNDPNDPGWRRSTLAWVADMNLSEAQAIVEHAAYDGCVMCEFWHARLES